MILDYGLLKESPKELVCIKEETDNIRYFLVNIKPLQQDGVFNVIEQIPGKTVRRDQTEVICVLNLSLCSNFADSQFSDRGFA